MNYPITRHRDCYPSPYCAQAWICSWYLLLVYTRYNSNPTAVSCTGILPCSLIRSATTDLRISQYSCTHISYFLVFCQALHIIMGVYQVYRTLRIVEHYNFIRTWFIQRGIYVQQYTWYPGIIRRIIWYFEVFIWYLVFIAGTYDKPCLRELSNQVIAGTLLTQNREETVMNSTKPWPYSTVPRSMEPRFVYGFK